MDVDDDAGGGREGRDAVQVSRKTGTALKCHRRFRDDDRGNGLISSDFIGSGTANDAIDISTMV